jgi:hypothetical protein
MEGCDKRQRAWRPPFLALPHGLPAHAPCGRGWARLPPQRLQPGVLAWPRALAQRPHGRRLALEGQTVQAAFDRATAASPWPLPSAWWAENGDLVMGPPKPESPAHESPALPARLPLRALPGGRGTSEARGGPAARAGPRRDPGGDDRLALPGKHQKAVAVGNPSFPPPLEPQGGVRPAVPCCEAGEASHGRPVRRRGWPSTALGALPALAHWPALPAVRVGATIGDVL